MSKGERALSRARELALTLSVLAGVSVLPYEGGGQAPLLPEGKGVEKVRNFCSLCHGLDVVAQQRLNRAGWIRVVDQMIEFGAPVQGEDRQEIIAYLSAFFGQETDRP